MRHLGDIAHSRQDEGPSRAQRRLATSSARWSACHNVARPAVDVEISEGDGKDN